MRRGVREEEEASRSLEQIRHLGLLGDLSNVLHRRNHKNRMIMDVAGLHESYLWVKLISKPVGYFRRWMKT